jgi:hypothetical protein
MTMSPRSSQRGSAMLVTMIIISALMAGAAALVGISTASFQGAQLDRSGIESLYCAEAGLAAARNVVAANYPQWAATLASYPSTAEPAWLAAGIGSHDIDGDGVADFAVYIKDDADELAPLADDPTHDNNLRVFLVARCLSRPDTPRELQELIEVTGGGTCYKTQFGGCRNDGNTN